MPTAAVLTVCALTLTGFGAGPLASPVARRLGPATATVALTACSVAVAASTVTLAVLVAYVGSVGVLPTLHPADWSAAVIERELPVPGWLAGAAGVLAALACSRAGIHLLDVVRLGRTSAAAVGVLPATGRLVVVHDDAALAFAVPRRGGRIVVSTGMLRLLSAPERRALLAHELAHLNSRHHVFTQLARLAAAVNPLVRPFADAVDLTVERWADRAAAREVGDPVVVARAIGKAALARSGPTLPNALGAAHTDVLVRVAGLLEPRPHRRWPSVLLIAAAALTVAGTLFVALHVYGVVELAEVTGS
ncbi:MAG: hypothetical protein ABS81_07470 [Pseudonocardia sp. SCN 72-86]|nr:MAG: hypothetical protein ABS81_07470 [Pseudonocardia sp. SCN 72-86]